MAKPVKPAKQNKLMVTTYQKKFESFKQMVDEYKTLHPELRNIFLYDEENVYPTDAADDVLKYFTDNYPDSVKGVNLPVSVSISANRVNLKTAKFFSIGWQFKYDRNGYITNIDAIITVFTRNDGKNSKDLEDMIKTLDDAHSDWYVVTK